MTANSSAKSAALRAIGPITARSPRTGFAGVCGGNAPRCGTRSRLGLWENTPQKCAGARSEPPMSEPNSSGTNPAASAAAEPPDDPPGVRDRSQGLLVVPYTSLKLCQSDKFSGTLVLPSMIAPAALSRCTTRASSCAFQLLY